MKLKFNLRWWGGQRHKLFTIVVFIILASLDDTARGVLPPLYGVMARSFSVTEVSLGLVTALSLLVIALTAMLWGYWGDRSSRKQLLFYGTLIWSVAMFLTSVAQTYRQLLAFQLVTAVGLGCIASVGFSLVTDLIQPKRRGLMMSLWRLSQGGGGGVGALLGSMLGAYNWRLPFLVIGGTGFGFALLYLFTYEPQRGQAEPELSKIFASGGEYKYRIKRTDIRNILSRHSNRWLILQVLMSTIAFGSFAWMPRLFIARVEVIGYSLETATIVGNLLSLLFQLGFYFAILGGYFGDLWQRRNPHGRAMICTIGTLGAVPFLVALFLLPLPRLDIPAQAGLVPIVLATLTSVFTNSRVAGAFLLALAGAALASAESPNRSALICDINLPEHRGTVAGLTTLSIGVGLAIGNVLTGAIVTYLTSQFTSPMNYAIALALVQLFFIPGAFFYYQTIKTAPRDIAAVKQILVERAVFEIDN